MPAPHPTVNHPVQITLAECVTRDFLLHHRVCPRVVRDDGALEVAVEAASLRGALDDLSCAYGRHVTTVDVSPRELDEMIERLTSDASSGGGDALPHDEDVAALADARDLANEPPVVRYVNLLIRDAHEAGASDIHLEGMPAGLSARLRIDGVLVPAMAPPAELQQAVVSRVKLLASLDIAERRRPQDGRIRMRLPDRSLDLRVSTMPSLYGESVVLRLLDRGGRPTSLEELGLDQELFRTLGTLASRPHGMVLVTGPTGSGKTTTLYACLQRRDLGREKVITVEDPIEYQLDGVTQVPVQRHGGVAFATVLRSALRQDPDVIMVGEMRDTETAEVAVQAAMTGHLVFSTLHTNDAVGAIARLLDLGIPEYLIAATLDGVLAQRLVRRICPSCRTVDRAAHVAGTVPSELRDGVLMRGDGCAACRGLGYRGRIGIFELLVVSEEVKDAITRRCSRSELRRIAEAHGLRPLATDGWAKVRAGLTTLDEVSRVVQS